MKPPATKLLSQSRLMTQALERDFRACQQYTRHFAKTFYFASHVLPKEKRMAAYALYAFCRHADELVDAPEAVADPYTASQRLIALRAHLNSVYDGTDLTEPMSRALQSTVTKFRIPQEYLVDLLRGVEMDLTKRHYETFAELEDYCYCVASTVGLMMTKVFGASNEEPALVHARDMGIAMQLTNILRDIGEDYARGRIYLPRDEMHRFGVTEEILERGVVTPEFIALMKFQIDRARAFYRNADPGISMLTPDGSSFCVKLMSGAYAKILAVIENNGYDSLTRRASVPLLGKTWIALRGLLEDQVITIPTGLRENIKFSGTAIEEKKFHAL